MNTRSKIKIGLLSFTALLILSGVTAFPIQSELNFLYENRGFFPNHWANWIHKIHTEVGKTPSIMFYGTDWLAFAHIIIALFFIPVYINPIKHHINLKIGMLACLMVFPLAFICGPIRGIPFFHQIIDCLFGVFGFAFLYFIHININKLSYENK